MENPGLVPVLGSSEALEGVDEERHAAYGDPPKLPRSCLPRLLSDNKDVSVMMSEMDVNAIAGTLKLYFRELPEPLFTDELYPSFAEGIGRSPSPAAMCAPGALV